MIRLSMAVTRGSHRATVANLQQYGRESIASLQRITKRSGERAHRLAYRLAPKDTLFMATHLRLVISAKRMGWQLGYSEGDFLGAGLSFYAVPQELGFRHWLSGQFIQNPHVRPAYRVEEPRYVRDVSDDLKRRAARMRARLR